MAIKKKCSVQYVVDKVGKVNHHKFQITFFHNRNKYVVKLAGFPDPYLHDKIEKQFGLPREQAEWMMRRILEMLASETTMFHALIINLPNKQLINNESIIKNLNE